MAVSAVPDLHKTGGQHRFYSGKEGPPVWIANKKGGSRCGHAQFRNVKLDGGNGRCEEGVRALQNSWFGINTSESYSPAIAPCATPYATSLSDSPAKPQKNDDPDVFVKGLYLSIL